jgi:hypothetical protein
MLLQCLRALSKAPGEAWSIWKYLEALVRATGKSERYAYSFRTNLHFDDITVMVSTLLPPALEGILTARSTIHSQ